MAKELSESSPQEKQVPASELFTSPLSKKQIRELQKLASQPDSKIDFSDAPVKKISLAEVEVGRFHRPIK